MKSEEVVFIVNPLAGGGRTGRLWPHLKDRIEHDFPRNRILFTKAPLDALYMTKEEVRKGSLTTVVAVGGDGTLNEVINGFISNGTPLRTDVAVGVIPLGTGCDLARMTLSSFDAGRAVTVIKKRVTRLIDIGQVFYPHHCKEKRIRYFHNISSFGLGGEVVAHVNTHRRVGSPFFCFLRSTLCTYLRQGIRSITLSIDGKRQESYTVLNIAVANGRFHGGGLYVAPGACLDDGLLHLTIIGNLTLPEIIFNSPKFYNGEIYTVKKVQSLTCSCLKADSPERVLVDVDGEQVGELPVEVSLLPKLLPLIVEGA